VYKSVTIDSIINVILPIMMGTAIYFLSDKILFPVLIKNFLPDGLWAYSLISCMLIVWNRKIHALWISLVFVLFFVLELLQYLGIISGTGDIFDIFIYFAFGL